MGNYVRFFILLTIKVVSRLLYRHRLEWTAPPPADFWSRLRVVNVLNHTSLYEWLYAGTLPNVMLWRIAAHSVVPIADKTIRRPVVGRFLGVLAPHFVPLTRESDHTWAELLDATDDPDSMVIIFPEGRMKRANGLDRNGEPMTVRGGISDILEAIPKGMMAIVYSGGLHHVQRPGETLPRLFKTLRLRIEPVEIAEYVARVRGAKPEDRFKRAVKHDLEARRNLHCTELERRNGISYDAPRQDGMRRSD